VKRKQPQFDKPARLVQGPAPAPKDPIAVELGSRGGKATARNRNPYERSEAARRAAVARWGKRGNGNR
jgi:hypothetical protein